ncbi:GMP synthase (glutamine-hydrolyzing) [Microbacterium resistens]|uniref:GMP synthase (Glutamine-hydrolyzing) n=1 Tax=Microbacterium resistens TaxID=156977 RepID=A0ABU1SE81_9MICO|nr:GMP synthase [Microbacterium resistens]MDR6867202.1 GMP synthase (glutamine-hydrolyzing) [Microbacterium resistens]
MASLLYVGVRPELDAATAERASFRIALGLPSDELDRIDLVTAALPEDAFDRYDGFVIGGSPFNVTDTAKSDTQRRVEADLERIAARALDGGPAAFFTCFGIGVVTRLLGGTVTTRHPEEASAAEIRATSAAAADPLFGPAGASFAAFTAHKEGSTDVPGDAVLLAANDACPVQAYRVGSRLYATQFHPEPSPQDFADRMVFYRTTGYFDPEAFDTVQETVLRSAVTEPARILGRFADLVSPH